MHPLLFLSLALVAPISTDITHLLYTQPATCSVIAYRDYDFYFYYHPTFRLTTACPQGTVVQVRKVSQALAPDGIRPLNVWPEGGNWFVSQHGDTVPTRFQLTSWVDKWQYRANTNDLWKDAVVR